MTSRESKASFTRVFFNECKLWTNLQKVKTIIWLVFKNGWNDDISLGFFITCIFFKKLSPYLVFENPSKSLTLQCILILAPKIHMIFEDFFVKSKWKTTMQCRTVLFSRIFWTNDLWRIFRETKVENRFFFLSFFVLRYCPDENETFFVDIQTLWVF